MTATGTKGQLHFGSREKRAVPVMAILQAGAAIGGTLIKGINVGVDAKRAKSFINAIKMVTANVELTHQRLIILENRLLIRPLRQIPKEKVCVDTSCIQYQNRDADESQSINLYG